MPIRLREEFYFTTICVMFACSKNGTKLKSINFRSSLKHLTPTNYDWIFEHVVNVIFVSTKN